MARKEFEYRGRAMEELRKMDLKEFAKLVPARERRTLIRGITEQQKIVLGKIRKNSKKIRTHCRDMVIIPEMVGVNLKVHNGKKEWVDLLITSEMLGHRLGEFALTRKKVAHSAPGVGATRSSAAISVR